MVHLHADRLTRVLIAVGTAVVVRMVPDLTVVSAHLTRVAATKSAPGMRESGKMLSRIARGWSRRHVSSVTARFAIACRPVAGFCLSVPERSCAR